MPEVSVILPTRDRPERLRRAVRSVLGQTFSGFELIIVDNNRTAPPVHSDPAFAEVLRDARVRVIRAPLAQNAAAARNAGLDAALGAWTTFLDDDDTYRPGKIAAQLDLARRTGSPVALCGYELVWPDGRRRLRQVHRAVFAGDAVLTEALLGAPALLHAREDALRFDEALDAGEDMPYALTFMQRRACRQIPCVPQPLVDVSQHTAGGSVHANPDAVWRAYRRTAWLARAQFSRGARQALLRRGELERALYGGAGPTRLARCIVALLRSHSPRKWRLAAHAVRVAWSR